MAMQCNMATGPKIYLTFESVILISSQFAQTKRGKFSSKEITKNYKKRLSGPSEEARELLSDAFENPESTPVHMINKNLQNDDKSDIIRKVIGELDSKDSTKLSNPAYQVGDDRRETRC